MKKEGIVAEIRRTAENNDGIPLGKLRFFKETGIREADWSGKYWAKWSEAIQEAGYTPNKKQGAYGEEYLLKKYAEFVIELGHLPTSAETRIKARNSTEFPSHNTFNRFGTKKQLVGHVLEFTKDNTNLTEAFRILQNEPHILPSEVVEESIESSKIQEGYVYLMQFGSEYKIGTSNNVERRFRELRTQMPYEGRIIHTIATGDPEGIEAYWHQYFSEKRLKGEWFQLSSNDIRYFKKRKLM